MADTKPERDPALDAFIERWSIMRLESTLRLTTRLDDASKQLIGVAGLLQGLYVALYAFGGTLSAAPAWLGPILITPLLGVVFFATRCVCVVPRAAEAMAGFELVREIASRGADLEKLAIEMDEWCQCVDEQAEKKRKSLHRANWSFVIATVAALVAVVTLMWP